MKYKMGINKKKLAENPRKKMKYILWQDRFLVISPHAHRGITDIEVQDEKGECKTRRTCLFGDINQLWDILEALIHDVRVNNY